MDVNLCVEIDTCGHSMYGTCAYVCAYERTCGCMCIYIYICMCMCIRMYVCTYVCMDAFVYVYMYGCVCVCMTCVSPGGETHVWNKSTIHVCIPVSMYVDSRFHEIVRVHAYSCVRSSRYAYKYASVHIYQRNKHEHDRQ